MAAEIDFDDTKDPDGSTFETLTPTSQYDDIRVAILHDWKERQIQEREDRKTYSIYLLIIFILQLILMYGVIFLLAFGKVALTDIQFALFFISVLAEIVALVCVAIQYMFSESMFVTILELVKYF